MTIEDVLRKNLPGIKQKAVEILVTNKYHYSQTKYFLHISKTEFKYHQINFDKNPSLPRR